MLWSVKKNTGGGAMEICDEKSSIATKVNILDYLLHQRKCFCSLKYTAGIALFCFGNEDTAVFQLIFLMERVTESYLPSKKNSDII